MLASTLTMFSQAMPYPTDTVKGKVFYKYPVQKGEGLYRISKNFGVAQEDIVKYNPELQNQGLKLGQIILIPYVMPIDSADYYVHELQPKETLYGLAKKYGVKMAKLQQLNPQTSKSMRIGEKLLIPKSAVTEKMEEQGNAATVETAEPQQPQTTQPAEKKEPVETTDTKEKEQKPQPASTDTISKFVASVFADQQVYKSNQENDSALIVSTLLPAQPTQGNEKTTIVVLLPFLTDAVKRDASVERFMEFYEGLLLAVNKARSDDHQFVIRAYDTDKTEARIQAILTDSAILTADAIIGPAYPQQVSIVTQFAKENRIPVVIPFTSKVNDLEQNPYIIQFNPTEAAEAEKVAQWVAERQDHVKCIFFNDPGNTSALFDALRKEIRQRQLPSSDASLQTLLTDSAAGYFADDRLNLVVLPSDKYSNMQSALQHLRLLDSRFSICIHTEYSWQKEEIRQKQLYTYLFDTSKGLSSESLVYNMSRRFFFPTDVKNDSPRYDMLGYDLTTWLVKMLGQPKDLPLADRIKATNNHEGLQSEIRLIQTSEEGGWMNKAIFLHDDSKLKAEKQDDDLYF